MNVLSKDALCLTIADMKHFSLHVDDIHSVM